MAALRLQAIVLALLGLVLCASATGGYYYGGHRRLSQANGRELLTSYYYGGHRRLASSYYYGGHHRRLHADSPMHVRSLFGGDAFVPAGQRGDAADVPVPHFLARQLQSAHSGYYYGGHHRRLSTYGGYYGGHHRRLMTSYYYGGHH